MARAILISVAASALLLAGGASASTVPTLVPTSGATYPERAYLLALPTPTSLNASQVRVTENGTPVHGVSVVREGASTTKSRSAVVLAIDESLTMKGRPLADAFAAARRFAVQAPAGEEVGVVTFNAAVNVLQPLTYSASAVASALARPAQIHYGTKNYNALQQSLALIEAAKVPVGAVIILTDGQNVGSTVAPATALRALAAAHVRVFSVGLASPAFDRTALEQMASATGGSYVTASNVAKLSSILAGIGARLSREYLVSYRSRTNPGTPVSVKVQVQGMTVPATTSYQSPALHIVAAPPYSPSTTARLVSSPVVMAIVVIAIVGLLLFAITTAIGQRSDPLLDRVGGFVTITRNEPDAGDARAERRDARQVARRNLLRRAVDAGDKGTWEERLAVTFELAGMTASPVQVVLLCLCLTAIGAFVLGLILGPIGVLVGLVGVPFATRRLILGRVSRKRKLFAEQLPDSLDVLASALRAGHSLVSAMAVVADDAPEPSKSEFRRVIAEEQFGVQLEDALKVASVRMDNGDLEQVALVARLQREMGSNSAEVLDRVIETVRGRMELRRLVRTLTAQGRLSRWILTGLPVGLAILLTLIDSSYMHPLFHKTLGEIALGVAVCMVATGSFAIGKIIDIKA